MAKYALAHLRLAEAEDFVRKAISQLTQFNHRLQSGEAYYVLGKIMEAKGDYDSAYDWYYKAFWSADSAAKAMTRIAVLDLRRGHYDKAFAHSETALNYGRRNNLAAACAVIALRGLGQDARAQEILRSKLAADPLDHMARFLTNAPNFYDWMQSDPVQTSMDMAVDLADMGQYALAEKLLFGLEEARPDCRRKPLYYALGYYRQLQQKDAAEQYDKAAKAPLGPCYPSRREEIPMLEAAGDPGAKMLLGCLYYSKKCYAKAAQLWEDCGEDVIGRRNLAVAYHSHLGRSQDALAIMQALVAANHADQQLRYETVVLMDKIGLPAQDKITLLETAPHMTRDDLYIELAKAYNQAFRPEDALKVLMAHPFVPCEGGEHAIADQYLFAHLVIGRRLLEKGDAAEALGVFQKGQVLPDSLGAGIWNHCKLVPLKYMAALALEQLGQTQEAHSIFTDIANIQIEYFSNMHLKELPWFQAMALRHLGETTRATQVITRSLRQWQQASQIRDNGWAGTTPFFISFMDEPKKLQDAQFDYLLALCRAFMGQSAEAAALLDKSIQGNNENLLALSFLTQGLPN